MAHTKMTRTETGRLSKNMTAPATRPRQPRLTRQEKSERSRALICEAAAEIIGEYGYADATISRIMERAGLACGTFYAYFDSRQDLFNVLLPMKGEEVLDALNAAANSPLGIVELEARAFLDFFFYVQQHPWFFRLLHEAHVATPEGYRRHVSNLLVRYRKLLGRHHDAGEMPGYDKNELDTLAFLLMSARDYVYSHSVARSDDAAATIRKAAATYKKFVAHGLRGAAGAETGPPSPPASLRKTPRVRGRKPEKP